MGGWVYIMTDRYRGTLYVGVTSDLPSRISQHRNGSGSDFCKRYGLDRLVWTDQFESIEDAIDFEKRLKRWRRAWKIELVGKANPDGADLFEALV